MFLFSGHLTTMEFDTGESMSNCSLEFMCACTCVIIPVNPSLVPCSVISSIYLLRIGSKSFGSIPHTFETYVNLEIENI